MLNPLKLIVTACALAASVSFVHGAQAAELAPHRAAYVIGLASARDDVQISAVSGQIAYSVEKVCGGWLQAQSGTTNIHLNTGDVMASTLNFSAWEADDGKRYRFSVRSQGGGQNDILGTGEINPGESGRAIFNRPEPAEFTLPKGTLFPVAHTHFMLDAARAGKSQVESLVFEGTDVEGAKLLVAFIGPLSDVAKTIIQKIGGDLLDRPGWGFRLAYFDPKSQTGAPMYEVEVDLLDNGVAPRWVLDYGNYAMEMQLKKLEPKPKPGC